MNTSNDQYLIAGCRRIRFSHEAGPDSNTSESTGTIKSVLTEPGRQADRNVQASIDRPRYEASDIAELFSIE